MFFGIRSDVLRLILHGILSKTIIKLSNWRINVSIYLWIWFWKFHQNIQYFTISYFGIKKTFYHLAYLPIESNSTISCEKNFQIVQHKKITLRKKYCFKIQRSIMSFCRRSTIYFKLCLPKRNKSIRVRL